MSVFALKQLFARRIGTTVNLDRFIDARRDRYVLCYHRIISALQAEDEGVHHSLWLTPEGLASQIKWMCSIGEIVDYSRIIDTTKPNDRPLFALTFDDGWRDNYEQAFPILKQYNVPALIFLATDAVDNGAIFWSEDISIKTKRLLTYGCGTQVRAALFESWPEKMLNRSFNKLNSMTLVELWIETLKLVGDNERRQLIRDYYCRLQLSSTPLDGYIMSWDEAREMQKHGIRFGSHTHSHIILKGLLPELIETELRKSGELISEKLQIEVDSFCYPNGRYNRKEGDILSLCGYSYGFCLDNMSLQCCDDKHYIPRFLVSERNTTNQAYFKLRLLEVPFYSPKPHNPHAEEP